VHVLCTTLCRRQALHAMGTPLPHPLPKVLTYFTAWQLWRNATGAVGTQRAAYVTQATRGSDISVQYVPDTRCAGQMRVRDKGPWMGAAEGIGGLGQRAICARPCWLQGLLFHPTRSLLPPLAWTPHTKQCKTRGTACCRKTRLMSWWLHSRSPPSTSRCASCGASGCARRGGTQAMQVGATRRCLRGTPGRMAVRAAQWTTAAAAAAGEEGGWDCGSSPQMHMAHRCVATSLSAPVVKYPALLVCFWFAYVLCVRPLSHCLLHCSLIEG
jgi:hypothetical protein